MIICQICQKEFKDLKAISHHIVAHKKIITNKQYYDLYILEDKSFIYCEYCGKEKNFLKLSKGYYNTCGSSSCMIQSAKQTCIKKYGVEHSAQSEIIKNKTKQTCIEKYGVEHYVQSIDHKEKYEKTCIEKYGDISHNRFNDIKDKKIKTCQDHFGVDNPSQSKHIKDKKIKTCQDNFGVDHPMQSKIVMNKSKETCLEKYGVNHPMQYEECFDKCQASEYKWKSYILPSSKEIKLQGYENIYLDEYFLEGNKEEDIIIHPKEINIGAIFFIEDGKIKRYYPDFYLPKENKIIEVKSTWTYQKDLEKNLLKKQVCIKNGFNFEFKIYNNKAVKIEI